jgi:hypothetical protein
MANVTVQGNTGGNDFSSSGGGMALDLNGRLATLRQAHPRQPRRQDQDNFGRSKPGGGIYLRDGNLQLENVLIAGNDGERGEALWLESRATWPTSRSA